MEQPVGVLALRIWRSDQGEVRARMSTKLDALQRGTSSSDPQLYALPDDIDTAVRDVRDWVSRYIEFTRPPADAD